MPCTLAQKAAHAFGGVYVLSIPLVRLDYWFPWKTKQGHDERARIGLALWVFTSVQFVKRRIDVRALACHDLGGEGWKYE